MESKIICLIYLWIFQIKRRRTELVLSGVSRDLVIINLFVCERKRVCTYETCVQVK
jgi:hypothetical protein